CGRRWPSIDWSTKLTLLCALTFSLTGLCDDDQPVADKHFDPWTPIPTVQLPTDPSGWSRTQIDCFIREPLERRSFVPAREAERGALIRRVTFDLNGLPPTPEAIQQFLSDSSPDGFERLVDQLLASPHYGEHWGRHWLDVARYADS